MKFANENFCPSSFAKLPIGQRKVEKLSKHSHKLCLKLCIREMCKCTAEVGVLNRSQSSSNASEVNTQTKVLYRYKEVNNGERYGGNNGSSRQNGARVNVIMFSSWVVHRTISRLRLHLCWYVECGWIERFFFFQPFDSSKSRFLVEIKHETIRMQILSRHRN